MLQGIPILQGILMGVVWVSLDFFFENVLYPSCVTLQEGPTGVFQQWGDPGGLTTDSDLGAWEVFFFKFDLGL